MNWPSGPDTAGLAADVDHRPRRLHESRLANVMPSLFALHCAHNISTQLRIRFARVEPSVKIVLHLGEQAGTDFAVGSKAHAAARSAKSLADRGDDADLALAVCKSVAARRLAGFAR